MRLAQVMADVFERHADRPAVGERAREFVPDARTGRVSARLLPRYDLLTYRQLWDRIRAVAGEFHRHPHHPVVAGDRVALLGFTSGDYATVDLACGYLGVVSVPLQTSASVDDLAAIVAETEPVLVATSIERLAVAVDLVRRAPSVRRLVVFDHDARVEDQVGELAAARGELAAPGRDVDVVALAEVLDLGATRPAPPPHVPGDDEDPLARLVYTSGSTGTPKGAIYPERLAGVMWEDRANRIPDGGLVTVHYMPLNHIAGYFTLTNVLARGGLVCFTARSDLSTLLDDLALVRPTELSLVPRVCELLHQRYQHELAGLTAEGTDPEGAGAAARTTLSHDVLGGRVSWATCGSAPLSATLTGFVEALLGVALHDLYGSTEVAGIAVNGTVLNPPVIDYKLVDVPELGYFGTDTPHPRGELRVKATGIPGYYRRPELTAGLFDEDGYYRTGDVVAELGPRRITVLDRVTSVIKLAQGEFVALARLEATFATAPLVRQIFVYGHSERSFLLAVVVPTAEALAGAGNDQGRLEESVIASLRRIGTDTGLNPYEIPRAVVVETEPFSQERGLLSDHRKLRRPQLVAHYGARLEQLYAELADREDRELRDLRAGGGDRPVLETVQRAARALLAGSAAEVDPTAHFRDLGGDSLSAVSLSNLLHDTVGVRVPVDLILSPAHDLGQLASYVEARRSTSVARPTFASVHGEHAEQVTAAELTLDRFLDATTLAVARDLPGPSAAPPRHVLLTGASGYLGRFLALEWLRRLAPVGGTLTVVIRGADPDAARQRLTDAIGHDDPELASTFAELAAGHLQVLAGDLAEPGLGLDEPTRKQLAAEVDLIVHAGALVNHVLPYRNLFDANVVGTAELIGLALTDRCTPITFVSSVVVAAARPGQPLDEDADVRTTSPVQPVSNGYADGYATSKWAGEVLLRDAHDRYGLPVTVLRPSMILAPRGHAGQLNVPDRFSRLLFSVLVTGTAPRSFYRDVHRDGDSRAHYDGLPVDFVAAAVAALGPTTSGYRTLHLVNPHDDGVSLDTVVDWLIADGHRIERIPTHHDWLTRVEAALRRLPEPQRRASILPLLAGFAEPEDATAGSPVPSTRFQRAVEQVGVGSERAIPQLDRALIGRYATELRRSAAHRPGSG